MPRSERKSYFWTRKLELELINFVRQREAIWRPAGNTNHDIQLKYKAYAEFAAKLGQGFTGKCLHSTPLQITTHLDLNNTTTHVTEFYVPRHA